MTKMICIQYLGTLGTSVRVPSLKDAGQLDVATGRVTTPPAAGMQVEEEECRLVPEELALQLVEQGSYRARSFLLAVDGAVADGKTEVQVLICARDARGHAKFNVAAVAATKDAPAVPGRDVAISLAVTGTARVGGATQLEPGLFVAMLTAPRKPGVVVVRGRVDGDDVALEIDFPAAPTVHGEQPAVEMPAPASEYAAAK